MKKLKLLKMTICGPGDVLKEVEIAKNVISDWNQLHAEAKGLTLKPRHWSNDSFPDAAHTGQGAINKQIIDDARILIAIFWSRIGTATSVAASGTIEEIQRGIKQGKKVMVYFSDLEPMPANAVSLQIDRLWKFRQELKEQCSCASFKSRSEFKKIFTRHLSLALNAFEPAPQKRSRPRKKPASTNTTQVNGENSGIAANTIINSGTMAGTIKVEKLPKGPIIVHGSLVKSLDHYGYVEYLVKKLSKYRSWRKGGGGPLDNPGAVRHNFETHFGRLPKDFPLDRFEDAVSYLMEKISKTALGKTAKARVSSFEDWKKKGRSSTDSIQ